MFILSDEYREYWEIYDKKFITFKNSEEPLHVTELEERSVTTNELNSMLMNSYARDEIYPKLTDETLIESAKHYINNCSKPNFPCTSYDEALIHKIVPELIKRLEETL